MSWLLENWPLKLLSFVIAVILWIFVRVEERDEVVLRIPVRYANLPEQLVVVGDPAPEIQMVVEGPGTLLTQVEQGVGAYSVEFAEAQAGVQRIRIIPDNIRLPRGVNIVRIVPSEIEVDLRDTQRYRLPLQALLPEDSIADGFEISNVEIEPSQIEIIVAKGELDGAATIKTVPLPISDRKTDWSGIAALQTDALHVKSITTREVEVFVQVVPNMIERVIKDVPIVVQGLQERYRPGITAARIKMAGPENLLKRMTPESIRAYIQVNNPLDKPTRAPVFADLPDQIFLMEIDPVEVDVLKK